MINRNRIERQIRRRQRQRLADLNRNDGKIFQGMFRVTLMFLAVLIGMIIWIWAAGRQAEMEAQAAVLRSHRITSDSIYALGPGILPGQNQNKPIVVESLPDFPPEDGQPPEALEVGGHAADIHVGPSTPADAIEHVSEEDERWESMGTFRLTFYCPCYQCSEGWGHQTGSGAYAEEGVTVAVDPRLIPYGTHLMIDGHEYIAQDCGGSIKKKRIDIFMESHSECLRNGIQYKEVFIKR